MGSDGLVTAVSEGSSVITVETENGLTDTCDVIVSYVADYNIDLVSGYNNDEGTPFIMIPEKDTEESDLFIYIESDKNLDLSKFDIKSDNDGVIIEGNKIYLEELVAGPGEYNLKISPKWDDNKIIEKKFIAIYNDGKVKPLLKRGRPSYTDYHYKRDYRTTSVEEVYDELNQYYLKNNGVSNLITDIEYSEGSYNSISVRYKIKEEFIGQDLKINFRAIAVSDNYKYTYLRESVEFSNLYLADLAYSESINGNPIKWDEPIIARRGEELDFTIRYGRGGDYFTKPLNANYTGNPLNLYPDNGEDIKNVFKIKFPDIDKMYLNEDNYYYHDTKLMIPNEIDAGVYSKLYQDKNGEIFPNTYKRSLLREPRDDGSILEISDEISLLTISLSSLNIAIEELDNDLLAIDIWDSNDDSEYSNEMDKIHLNVEW